MYPVKDTNVFLIGATRLDNTEEKDCGISNQGRKPPTTWVVLGFGLESVYGGLKRGARGVGKIERSLTTSSLTKTIEIEVA